MAAQHTLTRLITIVALGIVILCGVLSIFGSLNARARPLLTTISSDITTNTIWDIGGSPYIVATNTVRVRSGAVLTIEAGVEVRFAANARLEILDNAELRVLGANSNEILLTSNLGTPARGDWQGIIFASTAQAGTIQHAIIEYAQTGIEIQDSGFGHNIISSTFRHMSITAIGGSPDGTQIINNDIYSSTAGIKVTEAFGNLIQNNDIYDIDESCLVLNPPAPESTGGEDNQIIGNRIHDCGQKGILLQGKATSSDGSDFNQIIGNEIWNTTQEGIRAFNQEDFIFSGNTISNTAQLNTVGAVFFDDLDSAAITGNYLHSNGAPGTYEGALHIENSNPDSLIITGTRITDSLGSGLIMRGSNSFSSQTIQSNAICVDVRYELENRSSNSFGLQAPGNWLGINSPVAGTEYTGTVSINPFIEFAAIAAPSPLPADDTSAAIVTITMNDGAGHTMPVGARQINLASSLGNLGDSSLTLDDNGIATTTLTSLTAGTAVITPTEWCGVAVTTTVQFASTDLQISKTSAITQVSPPQNIAYTIAFTNNSSITATNVVITDTLPPGTSWVTDTAQSQGFTLLQSSSPVVWSRPNLGPDSSGVFNLVLHLPATALGSCGQPLTNTVEISSATAESSSSDNTASSSNSPQVLCEPNLMITKTVTYVPDSPGKVTTFTITYSNTGTFTAPNTIITDFLDTDIEYVTDTLGIAPDAVSPNVIWNIGDIGPGQADSFEFGVRLTDCPPGGSAVFTNAVTITADLPEDMSDNFAETETVTIPCDTVDLVVVKNDGIGSGNPITQAVAGASITYTINVVNLGGKDAANAILTETLPANTSFVGPTGSNGWFQVGATNQYTYNLGTLASFGGRSTSFIVQVNPSLPCTVKELVNTVQAGSAGPEAVPGDNTSVEQTPVTCDTTTPGGGSIYLPIILKFSSILPPTPPPPPALLSYVSDVVADPDTNQIFIASPRHDWVYVIDGGSDTLDRNVAAGNGPTGLAVLDAATAQNNKIFVAHQYGDNNWTPGVKAFDVNATGSHDTSHGGYAGAAPVKITANSANSSRVYVSNYFDKLAVIDGDSGPPENRLGWVVQKGFQGAYGIDTSADTHWVYLATRDTGELIVFDGNSDRLLGSDYIPTHVKPPEACSLWSVAVNEATGHVFVPCPQQSKVYVLAEGQVTVQDLEALGVIEERNGHLARVVAAAVAPWIATIDIPGGVGLGEEGIAVDSNSGLVFITNAAKNNLVILQDGGSPGYVTTVAVGVTPQGVDVNPSSQKVYVGNTGSNNVTVLQAASPFNTISTIPLTP